MNRDGLIDLVDFAVTMRISNLIRRGGPSNAEIEVAKNISDALIGQGDILLFKQASKSQKVFADLVQVIAILAFQPGGITVFGKHYEQEDR